MSKWPIFWSSLLCYLNTINLVFPFKKNYCTWCLMNKHCLMWFISKWNISFIFFPLNLWYFLDAWFELWCMLRFLDEILDSYAWCVCVIEVECLIEIIATLESNYLLRHGLVIFHGQLISLGCSVKCEFFTI